MLRKFLKLLFAPPARVWYCPDCQRWRDGECSLTKYRRHQPV